MSGQLVDLLCLLPSPPPHGDEELYNTSKMDIQQHHIGNEEPYNKLEMDSHHYHIGEGPTTRVNTKLISFLLFLLFNPNPTFCTGYPDTCLGRASYHFSF